MHKYEFAHIIECEGKKDDEIQVVIGNVRQLIADLGGRIQKENVWEAKELAYEIKKQNHGFYMFTIMTMEPEKMPEFEKKMSLMEGSLRYLLINLDNEPGYNQELDLVIEKPVKSEVEEEKPAKKTEHKKFVKKVEEQKIETEVKEEKKETKKEVKKEVKKVEPVVAEKVEVKVEEKKAPEVKEKSQEEIDKLIDEKLNELL